MRGYACQTVRAKQEDFLQEIPRVRRQSIERIEAANIAGPVRMRRTRHHGLIRLAEFANEFFRIASGGPLFEVELWDVVVLIAFLLLFGHLLPEPLLRVPGGFYHQLPHPDLGRDNPVIRSQSVRLLRSRLPVRN